MMVNAMRIHRSVIVNASAADAWELLAYRFGDIGQWTNAVDSSQLVGDRVEVGAERHCRVSGPGSGDGLTVERITAFDPEAMSYSYELVRGPAFITAAHNVITVTALSPDRCVVDANGRITLRWWLVPLTPIVSFAMGIVVRSFFRDLQYRLERHAPHPEVLAGRD